MSGRRFTRAGRHIGIVDTCDAGNCEAPRSKTGSFRKTVVHVGDYEKQFLRVIVCCAFRKLSGAFGSILPGPVKRRPPRGLHKETIFMGFPGCFQRSHRSLQDQLKSLPAEDAHSGVLLSLRLDRKYRAIEGRTPARTKKPMPFKIRAEVEPREMNPFVLAGA